MFHSTSVNIIKCDMYLALKVQIKDDEYYIPWNQPPGHGIEHFCKNFFVLMTDFKGTILS